MTTTTARTLRITADNTVQLYFDGVASEINTATGWDTLDTIKVANFPLSSRLVAVKCTSSMGPAGLLASSSDNTLVTDDSWVVSDTYVDGWNLPGFDDSKWAKATIECGIGVSTWAPSQFVTGFNSTAKWIWNQDTRTNYASLNNITVYFRKRLDTQLFVTADNQVKLYLDGVESEINALATATDWTQTKTAKLPAATRVIAAQVTNVAGPAGLLASGLSDTLLTDETWKVSGIPVDGWNLPTFDDSAWTTAVSQGLNGDTSINTWRGARPQISSKAKWIWIQDTKANAMTVNGVLYFRRRLW